MPVTAAELLKPASDFVACEIQLQNVDGSHDVSHIDRVRHVAKRLAQEEGLSDDDAAVCELAATLHDVEDHKYADAQPGAPELTVKGFLQQQNAPDDLIARVMAIISSVSFKDQLGRSPGEPMPLEAAVVQDADRLDAIGAVGIARCFTFGGRFNRKLHDRNIPPRINLTKEQYKASKDQSTTINHFYEKLLKLKDMMQTASGCKMAEQRHAFMQQFLDQFHAENDGLR